MPYKITRQQAIERAPLLKAWGEGAKLQYNSGYGWSDCCEMHGILDDPSVEYRIKPTEKQLRPWTAKEVPVGALIRNKRRDAEHNRYLILAVNGEHVAAGRGMYEHVNILLADSEHSLDHGKTWLPYGVLE